MNWVLQTPELSDAEFADWQCLLEQRTGISFGNHKLILQTGLNQRMREVGCADYGTYFQRVRSGRSGAIEWESLLKTLTVKETRFFRDPDAFDCVRQFLFDRLYSRENEAIEIWSVACSTGEEAYSLGMLANDCIESVGAERLFGVTATDICLSSLNTARQGIYAKTKVDRIDPIIRRRYFLEDNEKFLVDKKIKARTCFVQANIVNPSHMLSTKMDVIFCQNVLIYFKRWRQYQVLDKLVDCLKPEGILVVGYGEASGWQNKNVERFQDGNANAYIKKIQ